MPHSQSIPATAPPETEAQQSYQHRLAELRRDEGALDRNHRLLGYLRLAFAAAAVALLFPPKFLFLLPVAAFALAARIHGRALDRLSATRRAVAFFEHALARIEERWHGLHRRAPRVDASDSLYAADLDLFGDNSLFELLCETRTSAGENCLARWLLAPSTPELLRERQAAVQELRPRLLLRETLARAPGPALADLSGLAGEDDMLQGEPGLWPGYSLLAILLVTMVAVGVWRFASARTPLLLLLSLVVNAGVTFGLKQRIRRILPQVQVHDRSLATAAFLLRAFEREEVTSPALCELQQRLRTEHGDASEALRRLSAFVPWIEARSNYIVRLLDVPLLYSVQLALRVERWQVRYARHLACWIATLGELEALLSLAAFHFEHPADAFPVFANAEGNLFEATALGHPLLPRARCVRNDLTLDREAQLLLISGSNMSGKSTLMRSVGINAVLAFAGAPVRAQALRLSPLQVACSIQVHDSLLAGRSRFYAEILRLRSIAETANQGLPVLFLVDEILAGTNSSDRMEGALGFFAELLRKGAFGLASTHDLALTSLPGRTGFARVRNMHFQDEIDAEELRFDYQLRSGPVERSNGLALMRLIGLDV